MKDNTEMEVMLLGRIMSYPKEYYDNHSIISGGIFSDPLNKKIYNVVSERLDKGDVVDMVVLSSLVKDSMADYRIAECYTWFYTYLKKRRRLDLGN
jgi:replicative DNA helicase